MSFVYHSVPNPMIGGVLYPLNLLPSVDDKTYQTHKAKYQGREEVMQRKVLLLNCLWNDVLHCMPIHPQKVFDLQKEMGLINAVPPYEFFEIDTSKDIDISKAVIFFKTGLDPKDTSFKMAADVDIDSLEIPEATIAYYRTLVGTNEAPFNFQFVPHFLYQGTIDTTSLKKITLT